MKNKKPNETEQDKIQLSLPLNKKLLKYILAITFIIAMFYVLVTQPQKITSFFSSLISLLSPFIWGFCLAYVVNLLLRPLERGWNFIWHRLKKKNIVNKIRRPICIALSFIIVLGALFAIVFMIIPTLEETVVGFVGKLPQYVKTLGLWYEKTVEFFAKYNFELPEINLDVDKIGEIINNVITNYGNSMLDTTVTVTTSIVSAIVNVVLGMVFAIYLLAQKENLIRQTNKVVHTVFKPEVADRLERLAKLVHSVFTKFVTGQLTEAVIIAVLCFIGMLIFRMPYAGMVSVLIGFTALIPMFGAFIGTAIGAFLILFESPVKAIWFVVFIIILQQLENNLIYPKVVGKSVGLPGIWVLCAVTIGGSAFGILGMLFSVPICSVMYVLFKNYINRKNGTVNSVTAADDVAVNESTDTDIEAEND